MDIGYSLILIGGILFFIAVFLFVSMLMEMRSPVAPIQNKPKPRPIPRRTIDVNEEDSLNEWTIAGTGLSNGNIAINRTEMDNFFGFQSEDERKPVKHDTPSISQARLKRHESRIDYGYKSEVEQARVKYTEPERDEIDLRIDRLMKMMDKRK